MKNPIKKFEETLDNKIKLTPDQLADYIDYFEDKGERIEKFLTEYIKDKMDEYYGGEDLSSVTIALEYLEDIVDTRYVNKDILSRKTRSLSQSIDKLIMVFGHDMNSDEVDLLIDLSRAETELMNSVNEEDGHYKDGDLESFINYFSTKAYIQFHHIYHSYSFYNFCEAGIKLGNSD